MAASTTPRIAEPRIERHCIAVAYSGGRDSTALLHATLTEVTPLGIDVLALHVNHGLSPNADAWLAYCEDQCRRWRRRHPALQFVAQRLPTRPAKGGSVEAWARQARYRALREMAQAHGASAVLLAHHRRDQAETLLLQALRGAGVAGLAGMPRSVVRDGITWQRPWLHQPREAIEAYARRHRLQHIEDESNADPRFARNRLRLEVWPALTGAFAQAEAALATAAEWAQQADAALQELAQLDLENVAEPQGLALKRWRALSEARRSNALRAWLKAQTGRAASASLVLRLMDELPGATAGARSARWTLADGELRLHRGLLRHWATVPEPSPCAPREGTLNVHRAGTYALPGWGGCLHVRRVAADGVPLALLAQLELAARIGAEQFQAGPARPPRSLKKQYQSAGVAVWERSGPLLYRADQLIFVPGLGLDARVIGQPGQALVSMQWLAGDAGRTANAAGTANTDEPAQ